MSQIMRIQGQNLGDGWILAKILEDRYNLKVIDEEETNFSTLDALILIHPSGLSDDVYYHIDQYLMAGGRLVIFVDPFFFLADGHIPTSSPDETFKKLLKVWGIGIDQSVFAGDKKLSGIGRLKPGSPPSKLLALLRCDLRCWASYKSPISHGLNKATFVYPGALHYKELTNIEHKPIISTTKQGNTYAASSDEFDSPNLLWNKFEVGREPIVIAGHSYGIFSSAFDEKIVKSEKTHLSKARKQTSIFVFADVDFITDQFAYKNTFAGPTKANHNSTLALNAIEVATSFNELARIDAKNTPDRGLEKVENAMQAKREELASAQKKIDDNIERLETQYHQLQEQQLNENLVLQKSFNTRKIKDLAHKRAALKRKREQLEQQIDEKGAKIIDDIKLLNLLFSPLMVFLIACYKFRTRLFRFWSVAREQFNGH